MDMDRRGFLKLLGGLAALPVVGKVFKFSKKAVETAPKVLKEQGMPDFFYDLIAGVKKFGKKTKSERDFDVYEFRDPKTGKSVEVIDGQQESFVKFESDRGFQAEMGVKKGIPDETTKGKTPPDEYYEGEKVYYPAGPDDYTKEFEDEISGGYEGLESLAKSLREGKSGGGIAGSPPVYQTNKPKEAIKEIIRQTPFLGGAPDVFPIYADENSAISFNVGRPGLDPFQFGISGAGKYFGDIGVGVGDQGIGAYHSAQTPIPGVTSQISYNEESGPRLDLMYQKRFAQGGVASGPPPERGPMPQGLETLFQTR